MNNAWRYSSLLFINKQETVRQAYERTLTSYNLLVQIGRSHIARALLIDHLTCQGLMYTKGEVSQAQETEMQTNREICYHCGALEECSLKVGRL